MATAKPALKSAPPPPEVEEAPAPKKKSKRWLIVGIVVAVLVLAGGGAAAWYFLRAADPAPANAPAGAAAAPDKKAADAKPPMFVTLEPFTVNLQQENGEHFLQTGIVLQVADAQGVRRDQALHADHPQPRPAPAVEQARRASSPRSTARRSSSPT